MRSKIISSLPKNQNLEVIYSGLRLQFSETEPKRRFSVNRSF